jgi:hypothetical protein
MADGFLSIEVALALILPDGVLFILNLKKYD